MRSQNRDLVKSYLEDYYNKRLLTAGYNQIIRPSFENSRKDNNEHLSIKIAPKIIKFNFNN